MKHYESRKPKQHPVGMTFQYKGGTNAILYNSPADWISPNPGEPLENYREDPCANCTTKVVVNDTDHLWGHGAIRTFTTPFPGPAALYLKRGE